VWKRHFVLEEDMLQGTRRPAYAPRASSHRH